MPRTNPAAVKLPPSNTKRWTMQRKAAVVEAVQSGMVTIEQVCRRYSLSVEEFLSWHNTIQSHGVMVCKSLSSKITAMPARKGAETTQSVISDESQRN